MHINAGAAGLALALVLGKRVGFQKGIQKPHNVPLTLLGAALLWFGWFGFNAGSEAAVDGVAAIAWINTLAAPAAAHPRLAHRREDQGRQAHLDRRRLGRRRRPRRDHPGL